MQRARTPFLAFGVLLATVTAAARQTFEPARVSASVGGGVAMPVHSDLRFTAPEWQIALRVRTARLVVMEVFFDEWRHSSETIFRNVALTGPNGKRPRPRR